MAVQSLTVTATFERAFGQFVAPVLANLGFREVRRPDGWIAPQKLFECEDRWVGASWDWRDLYLAVALGRLYRFRDVMPRAIVRGPYHHDAVGKKQNVEDFLVAQLTHVAQELPSAMEQFDERLSAALRADSTPRQGATRKERRRLEEYVVRLGDPLTLQEWKGSELVGASPNNALERARDG